MTTKKKGPEKPDKKPTEKPADKLTTEEAITRLFPKPVLDVVRDRLTEGKK